MRSLPAVIAVAAIAFVVGAQEQHKLPGRPLYVADLNLPEHFVQLIDDREAVDRFQAESRPIAPGIVPTPQTGFPARHRAGQFVRVVRASEQVARLAVAGWPTGRIEVPRGFRAPILGLAHQPGSRWLATNELAPVELGAAALIQQRLAADGLPLTLAKAMKLMGPASFATNRSAGLARLATLGLPTDLLPSFSVKGSGDAEGDLVTWLARRLAEGAEVEEIESDLALWPFHHRPAEAVFAVAAESGEDEIGLLRMQAGGGYRAGVVPGGSIDVIFQLVEALREADYYISVWHEVAEPFASMVNSTWRLRRRDQLTLAIEPAPVAAWAQDNGKAGVVLGAEGKPTGLGTLVPRYACIGEGWSEYEPGESLLMENLRASGHHVVRSALLFQGGNLLPVRDPRTGERVLLLGEGEVHRNRTLGLTERQVLEIFRAECGVDRCEVIPGVSYHLDFDVSARVVEGEVVLFVNDITAALTVIVGLGAEGMARQGLVSAEAAGRIKADLAAGRMGPVLNELTNVVRRHADGQGVLSATISRAFVVDPIDSAAGNLQVFLLALDLLECRQLPPGPIPGHSARAEYLEALRRMDRAALRQVEHLRRLGWRIVPVPSMPDLYRSINYLNGLQHRGGYVMPAMGGFYAPLDRAAMQAFGRVLGPAARITPIRSSECQRQHGGVHCAAAAYPKMP
ncbi:MAG TPA: hypothetical protein VNO52_07745 [Methylomirabilota bacterium]|nr:hypothetical protein [Methylomirabilota bacterium]